MSADAMHSLLRRQVKRHFGEGAAIPEAWQGFVAAVDAAYRESDVDRAMLERSLELNSQELLQANSELRAIFQALPDQFFRLDRTGLILAFKAGGGDELALDARALVGRRLREVEALQHLGELLDEPIARALRGRAVVSTEYASRRGGEERFYEARIVPVPEQELVVIIRNITERRRAEAMRVGQSQILEMIAAGAPLADQLLCLARLVQSQGEGALCSVMLTDAEGKRLKIGAAPDLPKGFLEAIDGIAIAEGSGSCSTSAARKETVIVADIQQDPIWEKHRDLAAQHGIGACWSAPIISNENTVLGTFSMCFRRPRSPTPEESRTIHLASHIAGIAIARKQAEADLRTAEMKYRNIVENALEGIFQNTPEGRIIEANPALARMLGYASPQELKAEVADIGRQLYAEPGRYAEFKQLIDLNGVVLRFEAKMRRKDGREVCLSLNARIVRDVAGAPLYHEGLAEDVTERKLLEEQFRQAQKMDAFGQLAGGIAHDFNNMLMVIQMSLSFLSSPGLGERERAKAISQSVQAAERAASLTRQLLTFSRRQRIELENLDLNEVVAGMTQMFQRVIGEHITLEAHYAPGGAPVHADKNMLEQALMNLAVNSRDAMPKGGHLILRTVFVTLTERDVKSKPHRKVGAYVRLTVRDTGSGIAAEHLPHIFEPFYTTKEVGKGTGLGLATVFGVLEQHHGWIEVGSEVGAGTSFDLFFPRSVSGKCPPQEVRTRPALPAGSETILLVEDETAVREVMQALLHRSGYRVLDAPSGIDALPVWKKHRREISLLITDIVMPGGMNGRELSDRLRGEKPALKVIHCSGYSDEVSGGDSGLRSGVDFLGKPFDEETFLRRVRACLDVAG